MPIMGAVSGAYPVLMSMPAAAVDGSSAIAAKRRFPARPNWSVMPLGIPLSRCTRLFAVYVVRPSVGCGKTLCADTSWVRSGAYNCSVALQIRAAT